MKKKKQFSWVKTMLKYDLVWPALASAKSGNWEIPRSHFKYNLVPRISLLPLPPFQATKEEGLGGEAAFTAHLYGY